MSFKPKTLKKIKINKKSTVTLDTKHEEYMELFKVNDEKALILQDEIDYIKERLHSKQYKGIEERLLMLDDIKIKSRNIVRFGRNKRDYLLNHSKNVFDYFESKKQIGTTEDTLQKTVLNKFFNLSKKDDTTNNILNDSSKKYLTSIDTQFMDVNDYIDDYENCKRCNGELSIIDYEGIMVCVKCSHQERYLIEHEKPSYKEPPKEVNFYAYKRINHFREILAQFQAKESTQIDNKVIENIKEKIIKERITIDQLTNDKTKQILKNIGYNKYYEHIPFIKEKLGIRPPTMSIELETKLCNLFLEIQKPYAKFCPTQRVNFLNYYYVLYKLCELLEEDSYLEHFYMLKDPIKRMEQDDIWKQICGELKWEFIPTP